MSYKRVVRVAVTNNFNCTPKEYDQLDAFKKIYPNDFFFINSNIKTPKLLSIPEHQYKAVITLNPDITVMDNLRDRLFQFPHESVAFVRIKYVPGWDTIENLIEEVSKVHNVVITMQRFMKKESMFKYVKDPLDHYEWNCSRWRLNDRASRMLDGIKNKNPRTYICDRKGLGCMSCGLCSTLTCGKSLPIVSLNLSTSGICKYNCCDCYAKAMQHLLKKWGKPLINFDTISSNKKQSGDLVHIKQHKKAA